MCVLCGGVNYGYKANSMPRSNTFEYQTRLLIWSKTNNKDSKEATGEEGVVLLKGAIMVEEGIEVVEAEA
jgi:hypothetical protein